MKVAGIICEYNPFHNGHLYQLEQTRKQATHIICVMSGNYVQRGAPAIIDKWTRAKAAVNCGADLVIEMPTPWACSAAENFASCGVYLLASLKTEVLSFGCETENITALKKAAGAADSKLIGEIVKKEISHGLTYPAALRKAVECCFDEKTAAVFDEPNNTLATEYIRQSQKQGVDFEYLPIKRMGADHGNECLNHVNIASAAALRKIEKIELIKDYIPGKSVSMLGELEKNGLYPYRVENAERALLAALRLMSADEMGYYICDESGLAQRIYRVSRTAASYEELIMKVKVKGITLAAIRRAVFSCLLKIPASIQKKKPPYIKILAMNKKGAEIIKNSNCDLPIISRYSQVSALSDYGKEVYYLECASTDLYSLFSKKISDCSREQTSPIYVAD